MRIDAAFPSDHLKAADLEGQQVYTIKTVEMEEVGQEKNQKPVVYFDEVEKGLVLNKTNSRTISDAYGLETEDWIGHQIALYETEAEFQGKVVPAIRVKVPRAKPAPATRKKQAPAAKLDDEGREEIPF